MSHAKDWPNQTVTRERKTTKLTDFGKDVEEFNGWLVDLVELETDAHQGVGKLDQGQGHLENEKEQLVV